MELIPIPILFNPLKHHLKYINSFILNYSNDLKQLNSDLSIIGQSQIDFYIGALSIKDISKQILSNINSRLLDGKDAYIQYIHECDGYVSIKLNDKSDWILRIGNHPDRFVHIHPGRNSLHVYRLKANTLKSIIAIKIAYRNEIGLKEINRVRSEVLDLAPLCSSKTSGIGKYLDLFQSYHGNRLIINETAAF